MTSERKQMTSYKEIRIRAKVKVRFGESDTWTDRDNGVSFGDRQVTAAELHVAELHVPGTRYGPGTAS